MNKLLFFDIDNTLIPKGTDQITPSSLIAIEKARENGCRIVISTGRSYYAMQKDIKEKVNADYYITTNGPCINDADGKILKCWPIDLDTFDILCDWLYQKDISFGLKCDDGIVVYNRYDYFCDHYCSKTITKDMIKDCSKSRDYHKTHLILDCFLFYKEEDRKELEMMLPQLRFVDTYAGAECFLKEANKGNAIKELIKIINVDIKDTIAFGDSDNDIEMLKVCNIGVCMGNGNQKTKDESDYVTDDINADGIYKALIKLGVIND